MSKDESNIFREFDFSFVTFWLLFFRGFDGLRRSERGEFDGTILQDSGIGGEHSHLFFYETAGRTGFTFLVVIGAVGIGVYF